MHAELQQRLDYRNHTPPHAASCPDCICVPLLLLRFAGVATQGARRAAAVA
jgi:hypothetical protein